MAINPPRSNVQLLNPGALLANNRRSQVDGSGLNAIFGLIAAREGREFQAQQAEAAAARADQRTLAQLLAGGEAVRADDPRLVDNPALATLQSFMFSGTELVSGAEVSAALRQQALAAPATAVGGRELFEGTIVGDLQTTPSGFNLEGPTGGTGGSTPASRIDDFTMGSQNDAIATLEAAKAALGGREEFAGIAAEIDQRIATVRGDARFSLSEQQAVEERFGIERIDMLVDSVRDLRELDLDVAARVGSAAVDSRVKNQIQDVREDGAIVRRDMTVDEAHIFGKVAAGIATPDEQAIYDDLRILPRVSAMDRQTDMLQLSTQGATDIRLNAVLSGHVLNKVKAPDGSFDTSDPLFQKITADMGVPSLSNEVVSEWLRSPVSLDYRNAYALTQSVGSTVSSINAYRRAGGLIPFNVESAIAYPSGLIIPDAASVQVTGEFTTTGAPISGVSSEDIEAQADVFFDSFSGAPEGAQDALASALRSSDYSTTVGQLGEQADFYEALSRNQQFPESVREQARLHALNLRDISSLSPSELQELVRFLDARR
jgi:hypothetical protein